MKVTEYNDIKIGDTAEVVHTVTEEDIQTFGDLSGDYNPIHFDEEWAKETKFGGRIAHGLLTASFISTVIGMKLPGVGAIYLGQTLTFWKPVRIGDTITTKADVVEKQDMKKRIKLRITCVNQDNELVLEGESLIKMMKIDQ